MTTFNFKMTDEQIVSGIKSIGNRARSIRVDIHKIVCSITRNWAADGAVNVCAERMTSLLNEMDASHQQKLVNWVNNFCSFTLEDDGDGNKVFRYDSKKTKLTQVEWTALKTVTIFDFTPDKPVQAFNFKQKLKALIESAEKRAKSDNKTDEDDIPADMLEAAKALLSSTE